MDLSIYKAQRKGKSEWLSPRMVLWSLLFDPLLSTWGNSNLIQRGYPHDINLISMRMLHRLDYGLMNLCPSHTPSIIPTIIQSIEFVLGGAVVGPIGVRAMKAQVFYRDYVALQMRMMMLPLRIGLGFCGVRSW